jgi:hypothetical protein
MHKDFGTEEEAVLHVVSLHVMYFYFRLCFHACNSGT